MKKIFFFLISFVLITFSFNCNAQTSHFGTVIGKIENGIALFVLDSNQVKLSLSNSISRSSDLKLNFDKIIIDKNGSEYSLLAKDFAYAGTSRVKLVLDNGKLYEAKVKGGGYVVTCSGCKSTGRKSANECVPYDSWCSACSNGDCVKTVTSSSYRIILPEKEKSK